MKEKVVVYSRNNKKYLWVDTISWECTDQILVILVDITDGTVDFANIEEIRVVME